MSCEYGQTRCEDKNMEADRNKRGLGGKRRDAGRGKGRCSERRGSRSAEEIALAWWPEAFRLSGRRYLFLLPPWSCMLVLRCSKKCARHTHICAIYTVSRGLDAWNSLHHVYFRPCARRFPKCLHGLCAFKSKASISVFGCWQLLFIITAQICSYILGQQHHLTMISHNTSRRIVCDTWQTWYVCLCWWSYGLCAGTHWMQKLRPIFAPQWGLFL